MDNKEKSYFESASCTYNRIAFSSDTNNRMETSEVFRDGLSAYSIASGGISKGKNCIWSPANKGGVPMDYDAAKGTVYADGSDAHTLLIGATGSKKSRLVVMPTVRILGAAGESMVICDPKAEIYRRTSGFLKQKDYDIHVINLRNPSKGDGWNILEIPYDLFIAGEIDKACEYINDQAAALIPINSNDPYWDYSSRDLYVGLALLLFELAKKYGLGNSAVNIQSLIRLKTDMFLSTSSNTIKRGALWQFAEKHDMIRTKLLGIVVCPSDTLGCILSVFDQYLSCFTLQPQIISLLSDTTIPLNQIGHKKTAIFLIMPDEKSTYHKLITIFVKQIYELLIDQAYKEHQDSGFPLRVNFILDEFSSLPAISDFPQMIAASRSRNIRFTIVVQSKHQMKQRYQEETETIQSNCANWMFLNSREVPLLQEISTLAGDKGRNPLIPVSRLQHLDKEKGECLVFAGRLYPYLARLADISAYDNNVFQECPIPERISLAVSVESFVERLNDEQAEHSKTGMEDLAPNLVLNEENLFDFPEFSPEELPDFNVDELIKRFDSKNEDKEEQKKTEETHESRVQYQSAEEPPNATPNYDTNSLELANSSKKTTKPKFFINNLVNRLLKDDKSDNESEM